MLLISCNARIVETDAVVNSPDGKVKIYFELNDKDQAVYSVDYEEKEVIKTSSLGFDFKNMPPLAEGLKISDVKIGKIDETWQMPWGEQTDVRNHYNYLIVELEEKELPNRKMTLHFKAYNDGIGFRYNFPEQNGIDTIFIMEEHSNFVLAGDHKTWWIPGDWDIYEHNYSETLFSEIDAIQYRNHPNLAQTYIPNNAVNTPVTMRTADSLHLSFHEANLTDYAGMTLQVDKEKLSFKSTLVGSRNHDYKVMKTLPFVSPWRTIQISKTAGELIDSKLIVNLNEPSKIEDVSYFKPKKYMGIWWEMHLGKGSWDAWQKDQDGYALEGNPSNDTHSATTENAKRYIDFASENGITGLLVEGWNIGWERWIGFDDREGVFDFVSPYPDYDIEEVVRYGKEKGVEIIMHHETSSAVTTYDEQLDTAYQLMNRLGISAVKTGYVGKIIPVGEYHHGQWMVNHYRRALETAAKYNVAINAHEPIKATGIRRTLPNAISREGLRGQEFNAWSSEGGNKIDHLTTVAFTRMLGGPIDYTPGVFNLTLEPYKDKNRVRSTLAQQLALYVVLYSPVQMACDLPEYYMLNGKVHPMFQFITDVAVDWQYSKVLNGEVGDYVTIVRKEKGGERWFLGSITDESSRAIDVQLDFLTAGKKYKATIYADGQKADWDNNPYDYEISSQEVSAEDIYTIKLAKGGGQAILFELLD